MTPRLSTCRSKLPAMKFQSSLDDFITRKPNHKKFQKENRNVDTMLGPAKRNPSGIRHSVGGDIMKKRQKRHGDASQGLQQDATVTPLARLQNLGDNCSSPIVVSDYPKVTSWDETTLWNSPNSSSTIHVATNSCSPKATAKIIRENGTRTGIGFAPSILAPNTVQRGQLGLILAPDTPNRDEAFRCNEDPFIVPSHRGVPTCRYLSVIPSSQSQETEYPPVSGRHLDLLPQSLDTHAATCPSHRRIQTVREEVVPSSQSQYVLAYKMSPPRPSLYIHDTDTPTTAGAEIIPTSQILEEHELVPSNHGTTSRDQDFTDFLVPRGTQLLSVASGIYPEHTPTTPTSKTLQKPLSETVSMQLHGTPPRILSSQAETLPSIQLSASPPPMFSSQYSYLSIDASYPQEVKNFLAIFDDNHRSLGSDFLSSSLSESLAPEEEQNKTLYPGSIPSTKRPVTASLDLQLSQQSSLFPSSSSPLHIPVGNEPWCTFVEESYPPDVNDFLDMLDQDRSSLGSMFQTSTQHPSVDTVSMGGPGRRED